MMYKCPCCGEKALDEEGHYDICSTCGWEDDPIQRKDPDYDGGANIMSLNQARKAFKEGKTIQ